MERKLRRVRREFQERSQLVAEVNAKKSRKADEERDTAEAALLEQSGRALWNDFAGKGLEGLAKFAGEASAAEGDAAPIDAALPLRVVLARLRAEEGGVFRVAGVAWIAANELAVELVSPSAPPAAAKDGGNSAAVRLVFRYDSRAREVAVGGGSPRRGRAAGVGVAGRSRVLVLVFARGV